MGDFLENADTALVGVTSDDLAGIDRDLVEALATAWKRKHEQTGTPKPVLGAEGWMIYWVKRAGYFVTPRGDKLASMAAAKRWLQLQSAAGGSSGEIPLVGTNGRPVTSSRPQTRMGQWVACDRYDKWRRLPTGVVIDNRQEWFCSMHPGLRPPSSAPSGSARTHQHPPNPCDAPEDKFGDDEGWYFDEVVIAEHAAKAIAAAEVEGLLVGKYSRARKQVRNVSSTEGTPYQAWASDVGGGSHFVGAYVSPEEAALATARFERVCAHVLAGRDLRLLGQTIAVHREVEGVWYRGRLSARAGGESGAASAPGRIV